MTQDVLAEAIGSVELGFWRETPIEDPDGVHGIEARFDVRAFAEAITAALAARGYALVRTPETLDAAEREARAAEIAAGLTELGTGGTPAFIRGYNRGYDDAYEHAATPETLDVERLARAIERAGITYPSDRLADPYFLETAEDIAREYVAATPSPAPPEGLREALRAWALQMANAAAESARKETKPERREWHHGAEHIANGLLTWIGDNWLAASPAPDPGAGLPSIETRSTRR